MGTNFYVYQYGEETRVKHIGKTMYRSACGGKTFIFFLSRDIQLETLRNLTVDFAIKDEYGNTLDLAVFLRDIQNLPFTEATYEFC